MGNRRKLLGMDLNQQEFAFNCCGLSPTLASFQMHLRKSE